MHKVVGWFSDLAHRPHLGRDLCKRAVTPRYLEWYQHPFILRQACAATAESDYKRDVQCSRWDTREERRAQESAAVMRGEVVYY